jgi:secreted PhoX family phosphatase
MYRTICQKVKEIQKIKFLMKRKIYYLVRVKPNHSGHGTTVQPQTQRCRGFLPFLLLLALPLAALGQANYANPYTFATLAGQALITGSNDGTGSGAHFNYPDGLALDSAGNLYIVDQNNSTIRMMTPSGAVTTLAGLAHASGSADGTGNAARFNNPWGLARDNAGNLYVGDQGNHTMRKVSPVGPNWVVTTMAGLAGAYGGSDGTNSAARFNHPDGVAVDQQGNVYVADDSSHTIRMLTPMGPNWVVTTVAGKAGVYGSTDGTNSAARFNKPTGVVADNAGNLYVADFENNTIRKITPVGTNWVVTTVAGLAGVSGSTDGTNSAARFYEPNGVALDNAGNLYVTDYGNNTIREMMPVGTNWVVTTLGGLAGDSGSTDGTGSIARFSNPTFMAVDKAGDLYVSDRDNDIIRRGFMANGTPVIFPSPPGLAFSNGLFGFNLTAAAGQPVVVEASTDLMTWLPISTNTIGPSILYLSDPQSGVYSNRFYRAQLP